MQPGQGTPEGFPFSSRALHLPILLWDCEPTSNTNPACTSPRRAQGRSRCCYTSTGAPTAGDLCLVLVSLEGGAKVVPREKPQEQQTPEGAVNCVSSAWGSCTAQWLWPRLSTAVAPRPGPPARRLLCAPWDRAGRRRPAPQRPTPPQGQHRPWRGGAVPPGEGLSSPWVWRHLCPAGTHSRRPRSTRSLGRPAHF